jgi:hypothetical protein
MERCEQHSDAGIDRSRRAVTDAFDFEGSMLKPSNV